MYFLDNGGPGVPTVNFTFSFFNVDETLLGY